MPEHNTISLVIPPESSTARPSLESQIQQIISQRGHFRHITERSLLADLHGKTASSDTIQSNQQDEAHATQDDTPQKRTEQLWERRTQMLERLSVAQNEILCALDLVSWLISQQSVAARHSMSAPLKEAAPIGSLAARALEERPVSLSARRQLTSVSQAWRSESFRSSSEKLAAASSRLNAEAERESQFWQLVADLKAKGWPISRLPRDRKAIGVHFGFAEAAPQFRDRGFALLAQAADGSVGLDTRLLSKKRQQIAVYLVRNGIKTGASYSITASTGAESDIHGQLTKCRDALFEEELFYEICREARLVANQGITTRADTVEIDVGTYQLLLIFAEEQEAVMATNEEDDQLAAFVAISLRLFLSAAHTHNLSRRSQKLPALTTKPRTTPEYALVRPILTHLRHRAEARQFWVDCQSLLEPFQQAKLPLGMAVNDSVAVFGSLKDAPSDSLLSDLKSPAKTAFKLTLTDGRSLQIGTATYLGPPLLGSRYEFEPIDFGFSTQTLTRHETRATAKAALQHLILLDLVAHVDKLATESGSETDKDTQRRWTVTQPHNGELTMYVARNAVHTMRLSVQTNSFGVRLSPAKNGPPANKIVWTWSSVGCSRIEGSSVTKTEEVPFREAIMKLLASAP